MKPLQPFLDWYYQLKLDEDIDEKFLSESQIYLVNDEIKDLDIGSERNLISFSS
jgi:hypothetical protein